MIYFKHCFVFILAVTLATSCEERESGLKKGSLEFSFAEMDGATGGRIKQNVSSIVVTVRSNGGEIVHERKKLSLFEFAGSYLSEPIALTTGDYSLTEFIVLDESGTAIYATPIEGSSLAHLVDDPLPIGFTISKDQVSKVTPQVIGIEGNAAVDFGYTTFSLDVVETFSFNAGVLAYSATTNNFELTSSHMTITSSGETLYDKDLTAATQTIRIRDGYELYKVIVTKSGYATYEKNFSGDELKTFGSGSPLVVTLLAESLEEGLIAWYPFNGNANDMTANHLNGVVYGAVLTVDKDGHAASAYRFDGVNDYIGVAHNDLLNPDDFTISLWADIASSQEPHEGINDIIRKWNGDAQGYPFGISYLNTLADDATEDRIIYARYDGQVCDNGFEAYSPLITNDAFVHIALVKDGDHIRTYLNNVLIEDLVDPTTCDVANVADMTIGARGNLVRFFKGTIDDIRIYDRALNSTEVGNLYGE